MKRPAWSDLARRSPEDANRILRACEASIFEESIKVALTDGDVALVVSPKNPRVAIVRVRSAKVRRKGRMPAHIGPIYRECAGFAGVQSFGLPLEVVAAIEAEVAHLEAE
jgi:hypothetical protein